ncbi:hypothetical protein ANO14919_007500 [Xylariales sp. No.14919]|nr:hypothetical protein ANO14919_007500 [Xylariales sp. No.14919]
MASATNASARLPCLACRAIVPDRRQLTHPETSTLKTLFERDDLYPAYPSVALSAQTGCSLCVLMWRRFTSIPSEAIELIKGGKGKIVWVSSQQRTRQLEGSWDQKVKISATFDFISYYTTVSPSGSAQYRRTSTPQDRYQYGGAVTSMTVKCRPVSGSLRFVDGDLWSGETFEFPLFDSIDLHALEPERRRQLPSSVTLSNENVAKMKYWVNSCLSSHPECSNARTTINWIPDRLLEIDDGDHSLRIRLVESSEINPHIETKFAALSHVWGDLNALPPLRLLSSNLGQFKNGIEEVKLPKNFIDAAHVCARLGIRYLWIDSLCIIQDSADDWREQAILMHLVYSHALITIVATSAVSCHEGFLERNIDSIPTANVAYSLPAAGEQSASRDGYMIIYDYENPQDVWRMFAINGSKWNTRAWTMQERSLSTRMVHFCRNKIFFECRGCLQSEESEPVQESDIINSTLWPRNPSTSYNELHQHWQLFIGEYTSRNLTISTDRLPAIRSVAEEMASVTGKKYIQFAGMWESNLRHELLWHVSWGRARHPDVWRAPSWSWAAVDGQVSLWQRDFRNFQQAPPDTLLSYLSPHPFEVLDIDQEYTDLQKASRGFIKVRSLAKRFDRLLKHDASERGRAFFSYDLAIDELSNKHETGSGMKVFAFGRLDIEDLPDFDVSPTTPGTFLYLHVNNDARATGIILRAQPHDDTRGPRAWIRIGVATLFLDRSETPIANDAFSHDDTPQVTIIV